MWKMFVNTGPVWNICVTNGHGYIPLVVDLSVLSSFMTCHRVCKLINTKGATSGAGTVYPS